MADEFALWRSGGLCAPMKPYYTLDFPATSDIPDIAFALLYPADLDLMTDGQEYPDETEDAEACLL